MHVVFIKVSLIFFHVCVDGFLHFNNKVLFHIKLCNLYFIVLFFLFHILLFTLLKNCIILSYILLQFGWCCSFFLLICVNEAYLYRDFSSQHIHLKGLGQTHLLSNVDYMKIEKHTLSKCLLIQKVTTIWYQIGSVSIDLYHQSNSLHTLVVFDYFFKGDPDIFGSSETVHPKRITPKLVSIFHRLFLQKFNNTESTFHSK